MGAPLILLYLNMNESVNSHIKRMLRSADVLRENGDLLNAALTYKSVVELDPSNLEAHLRWADIARQRGNLQNSAHLYGLASNIDQTCLEAQLGLAKVFIDAGQLEDAEARFNAILSQENCAEAHNGLAIVQIKRGDFVAANSHADQGLQAKNDYGPLHQSKGFICLNLGDADAAIRHFEKAAELLGGDRKMRCIRSIGVAYADMGDRNSAERYFREALELRPDDPETHGYLASVHRYEPDDPHISEMEDLLASLEAGSVGAITLHFALGRAYDQVDERDEAFRHFSAGNFLNHPIYGFSKEKSGAAFSRLAEQISKMKFIDRANSRICEPTPIFIVGMPRSGTTLAEQILQSHKDVGAAGEVAYLENALARHGIAESEGFERDWSKIPAEELLAIRDEYLSKIAVHAGGKPFVTDKMPMNFRFSAIIPFVFPDARIVSCRREAMDTCWSIFKCRFSSPVPFAYDLSDLAFYYRQYDELMLLVARRMGHWVHELSYERLVEDPESEIRNLLKFCGLAWDKRCLEPHKSKRVVLTASALQVSKPISKGSVGEWKRYEDKLGVLARQLETESAA